MNFTSDEEKLLTPLDAAAHDLLRVESERKGMVAPCWLTCSNETRDEYRRKIIDMVNEKMGLATITMEFAPKQFARLIPPALIERWRAVELEYKRLRIEGNPRAFFT